MATSHPKRKIIKRTGIVCAILVALALTAHWWLSHRAEIIVSEFIQRESGGLLIISIDNISLNYRTLKLDIDHLRLLGIDSTDRTVNYKFTTPSLSLQLKNLWPFIWNKELDIAGVVCTYPSVELFKGTTKKQESLTVSEQIGKIYISIQRVINRLAIKRLELEDGQIKIHQLKAQDSISLTKIYFRIDNFKIDSSSIEEQAFLSNGNITLKMGKQTIYWNKGRSQVGFNQVSINTNTDIISIDSCYVKGHHSNGEVEEYDIVFDSLKLLNPDFKALYLLGNMKVNSAYCVNPKVDLKIRIQGKDNDSTNSKRLLANVFGNLMGTISAQYIGVQNADLALYIRRSHKTSSFVSTQNSFNLRDIVIDHRSNQPVNIGFIDFAIRNNEIYTSDSAYVIRLDSVHLIKNKLVLNNFTMATTPNAKVKTNSVYTIPRFELTDVSWLDILEHKRLVAANATLYAPNIDIAVMSKGSQSKKRSLFNALPDIETYLDLEKLIISNGQILYKPSPNVLMQLSEVDAIVNMHAFLKADNIKDIREAFDAATFSQGIVKTPMLNIVAKGLKANELHSSLIIKAITIDSKIPKAHITANELTLKHIAFNESSIDINGIHWEKASVHVALDSGGSKPTPAPLNIPFALRNIAGKNTNIELSRGNVNIKTHLTYIALPAARPTKSFELATGSYIHGEKLVLSKENLSLSTDKFEIHRDTRSNFYNTTLHHTTNHDTINVSIPLLTLGNVPSTIDLSKKLFITSMVLFDPAIHYKSSKETHTLFISLPSSLQGDNHSSLHVQNLEMDRGTWSAFINKSFANNLFIESNSGIDSTRLLLNAIHFDSLQIASDRGMDIGKLLANNPHFSIKKLSATLTTNANIFTINKLMYNNRMRSASIAEMSYTPLLRKEEFINNRSWQSDYIQAKTKGISISNIGLPEYFQTSELNIGSITVDQPVINVFRDKRLPFKEGIRKPLPTDMIRKIPIHFNLDTFFITDGSVNYTELYPKTNQEGSILFNQLHAAIHPIKNHNYELADSLHISAKAHLMHTSGIRLLMKQAYADPQGTFILNVRMPPADLTILNALLNSAASTQLLSGHLDTLDIKAIADDQLAKGHITMLYRNLKLSVNHHEKEKKILNKLTNFIVNGIIKNNNKKKSEPIIISRNQDRSIFNYWAKIGMNGIMRSGGIRKPSKLIRQNRKNLKTLKVPELRSSIPL